MGKLDFYDLGSDRPWINVRLTNAAIVGHTTKNSARLWARVWERGKYWLLLSQEKIETDGQPDVDTATKKAKVQADDGSTRLLPGSLWSKDFDVASDLTGVFELTALEPNTKYYYCIFSDAACRPMGTEARSSMAFVPDPAKPCRGRPAQFRRL